MSFECGSFVVDLVESWSGGAKSRAVVVANDPVTNSLILFRPPNSLTLIPHPDPHNIKIVQDEQDEAKQQFLRFKKIFEEATQKRHENQSLDKTTVIAHFEKHQLKVSESVSGSLVFAGGVASIEPPYSLSDIKSSNPVVLDRMRNILGLLY